jgi:hypothetical protein
MNELENTRNAFALGNWEEWFNLGVRELQSPSNGKHWYYIHTPQIRKYQNIGKDLIVRLFIYRTQMYKLHRNSLFLKEQK